MIVFYFNNLKYSMCKIFILIAFILNCVCVYTFHPVEPLIAELVTSMGAT